MDEILANALKTLEGSRKLRDDAQTASIKTINERIKTSNQTKMKSNDQKLKEEKENSDDSSLSDILKQLGKDNDEKFNEDYDISSVTSKLESSLKKPVIKPVNPKSEPSIVPSVRAKAEGLNSKFRPTRITRSEGKSCDSKQDLTIDENSSIRTELEEDSSLEEIKTEISEVPSNFQPVKIPNKENSINTKSENVEKESLSQNTGTGIYENEEFNSETLNSETLNKNGVKDGNLTGEESISASFSLNVKSKIHSVSEDWRQGFPYENKHSQKSENKSSRDGNSSKYRTEVGKVRKVSKSVSDQNEQKTKMDDEYEEDFLSDKDSTYDSETNKKISRAHLLTHYIHQDTSESNDDDEESPIANKESLTKSPNNELHSVSGSATFLSHESSSVRETISKRISDGTMLFNEDLKKQIEQNNKDILNVKMEAQKKRHRHAMKKSGSLTNAVNLHKNHPASIPDFPSNVVKVDSSEDDKEEEERERINQIATIELEKAEKRYSESDIQKDSSSSAMMANASDTLREILERKLKAGEENEDEEEDKEEDKSADYSLLLSGHCVNLNSSMISNIQDEEETEPGEPVNGLNAFQMAYLIREVETKIAKTIKVMGQDMGLDKETSEREGKKKKPQGKEKDGEISGRETEENAKSKFVFVDKDQPSKVSTNAGKKKEKSEDRKHRTVENRGVENRKSESRKREKVEVKKRKEPEVVEIEDTIKKALDLKNEIEMLEKRITSSHKRYTDFEGDAKRKQLESDRRERETRKQMVDKGVKVKSASRVSIKDKVPSKRKDKLWTKERSSSKERLNKVKANSKNTKEKKLNEFRKTWKESEAKNSEADAAWEYLFKTFEVKNAEMDEKGKPVDSSLMELEKKLKKAFEDKKTTTEVDVLHAFVEDVLESNKRMHKYALEACRDIEKEYNKKIKNKKK